LRKKFQLFLKNNVFFHKCCKNTKIVSGYAYFTQKLFKMCLKGCCGLVCAFRWKKKRILKVLVLVKIWSFFKKNTKKREFSLLFFLTPPFFWPETDKLPKKSHRPSQMTKMLTKKIFMTFWSELVPKIQNVRPPPYRPYRGGGCFWNNQLSTIFTWHVTVLFFRK